MSRTEDAIAATPSVRTEALNQTGVAEAELPFVSARSLERVVVETVFCIAREFIKGSGKDDPRSHTK